MTEAAHPARGMTLLADRLLLALLVGIAYCRFRTNADDLMAAADAALHRTKKAGRNTWHLVNVEGPEK